MNSLSEKIVEEDALEILRDLGYETAYGPDIVGNVQEGALRANYTDVVLLGPLRSSLVRINSHLPPIAIDEALRRITRLENPSLIENNRSFQKMLTDGIEVSWIGEDGETYGRAIVVDPVNQENNHWLAVNQFTVVENKRERVPDLILFVNGLPLVVMEMKNPANERTTIYQAYKEFETYKAEIPSLFAYNTILVTSDGTQARAGTITSGWDRFMPWRTIDGTVLYKVPGNKDQTEGIAQPGLETLIKGMFNRDHFLDYALNFITFEHDGGDTGSIAKKAAGYHQYHAVNKAIECTLSACGIEAPTNLRYGGFREAEAADPFSVREPQVPYRRRGEFGDRKIGVVWHTQGAGKSLSMLFYASKIIRHPYMENPTILLITDRNDLDDQLFGTFSDNQELLRQTPVQAPNREELRELLTVASGGVIFTTIQKFLPEKGKEYPRLSDRRNIVVIADEAHRSQYGFEKGFARHLHEALPKASFIGFTGTPIETGDRNTPAVFGDYIDKYDMLRAVEDGATVPIYYESRLAKIELDEDERPFIDGEFEEITEGEEEETKKQRLRSKWASVEAMVGTEKRIGLVAADLVAHFEKRQESIEGKALIVCMSRRICVDMYNAIIKLRPSWHDQNNAKGRIKIVMSGSASDHSSWQEHSRTKKAREAIAKRFKDPDDELSLVIVRDMWLTGFDCPSMHTMYVDKPMASHNLMQAITRVNRVFRDKPGGRVVDYLGLANALKRALHNYTSSGGKGRTTFDPAQAVDLMLEKYEVIRDMLHGFDYAAIVKSHGGMRLTGIVQAMEFILGIDDGKKRFLRAVTHLSKAFALSSPDERALAIRDELLLFQEIRASLVKTTKPDERANAENMETAIRQLVSRAISSNEVVDIFSAAGLDKPDISILSDNFLADVKKLPYQNLALELLRRLLNDEINVTMKKNLVQARSFATMLEEAVNKYRNKVIESAEVIEELIILAKELRAARIRGENLGLTDDETAFYDALGTNDSAVQVLGDNTLKAIAQELVDSVRKSITIDWTRRESARAKIRVAVRRILTKHGYPPDLQERATELVLEQATVLSHEWSLE